MSRSRVPSRSPLRTPLGAHLGKNRTVFRCSKKGSHFGGAGWRGTSQTERANLHPQPHTRSQCTLRTHPSVNVGNGQICTVRTLAVSANRKCCFALSVAFGDSSPKGRALARCLLCHLVYFRFYSSPSQSPSVPVYYGVIAPGNHCHLDSLRYSQRESLWGALGSSPQLYTGCPL